MKIEIEGRAQTFDRIVPGTFFKVMRSEPFFAFSVADENGAKAALAFKTVGEHGAGRVPRFVERGFPQDALLAFPEAVLYSPPASGMSPGSTPIGAVALSDKGFFMKASDGMGSTLNFDLETGLMVANVSPSAVFQEWSIGHWRGPTFEPLFSFPEGTRSQE